MTTTAGELANRHAGVIEAAIRKSVEPGMILRTVPARAPFKVQKLSEGALVLLFGKKRTRTTLPWPCLESVMRLLMQGDLDRNSIGPPRRGGAGVSGRPHQVERWTGKDDRRLRRGSSRGSQGRRCGFEPAGQGSAQQGHCRQRRSDSERTPCLGGSLRRPVLTRVRCAEGYSCNCPWDGPDRSCR